MNLRTFTAQDMPAALALVRRELGPNAVILHTRTQRRRGWLGLFRQPVVEITAADAELVARYRGKHGTRSAGRSRSAAAPPARALPARPPEQAPAPGPEVVAAGTAGDLIRRTYAAALAELHAKPAPALPAAGTRPPPALAAPSVLPPGPGNDQLAREMRTVRSMVELLMRRSRDRVHGAAPPADLPPSLFQQYLALLEQEVAEELADGIVEEVRAALGPESADDPARTRRAVLASVARLISVDDSAGRLAPTSDGRPRTIALVGPTGVGKTTTIAKLAAGFKLRQRRQVALVTLDTYRIAAVDQLKVYAQIIGVPLFVVSSVGEMQEMRRRLDGRGPDGQRYDVVLIDTAGRSQRDAERLEQLSALLEAAAPHEVHLCLSSTCAQSVLLEAAERFSVIRTDRIIFTKLDEAVSFGVVLNVARKVNKRLSFVTTGQEVPHHIEPGRAERLAGLLLGEEVRRAG